MKYLLLLVVGALVVFLLGFKRARPAAPAPKPAAKLPKDMVACLECGLHLPRDEALPGRGGHFCCEAHRSAHESAHAP